MFKCKVYIFYDFLKLNSVKTFDKVYTKNQSCFNSNFDEIILRKIKI